MNRSGIFSFLNKNQAQNHLCHSNVIHTSNFRRPTEPQATVISLMYLFIFCQLFKYSVHQYHTNLPWEAVLIEQLAPAVKPKCIQSSESIKAQGQFCCFCSYTLLCFRSKDERAEFYLTFPDIYILHMYMCFLRRLRTWHLFETAHFK